MNKKILTIIILSIFGCKSTMQDSGGGTDDIWIEILTEETRVNEIGGIELHFIVVNNSKKDITILKPRYKRGLQVDFFSNRMECEDVPIWLDDSPPIKRVRVPEDLLIINGGSQSKLVMDGRLYDWLACDSDSVEIDITYNPIDTVYLNERLQHFDLDNREKYLELLENVSRVKFKSSKTKFMLER